MGQDKHKKHHISIPVAQYDICTGGLSKTGDFVVFYNRAVRNVESFLIQAGEMYKNRPVKLSDFDLHLTRGVALQESTYRMLAEFLWKDHLNKKNKDDQSITSETKHTIHEILSKLNDIRNYHSHIAHDNKAIECSKNIKKFISNCYEIAISAGYEQHPMAIDDYKRKIKKFPLFKKVNNTYLFTLEGRIFFLSFFLLKSQMNAFLQQRTGTKRADQPLYKMKRFSYTYYCQRDGRTLLDVNNKDRLSYMVEPETLKNITNAAQGHKIIQYLYDYPDYLADKDAGPLYLPESDTVCDTNEVPDKRLALRPVQSVQDLLLFITKKGVLQQFQFTLITTSNSTDTSKDEHTKIQTIEITYPQLPEYIFHIGFSSLYKLVLLSLRGTANIAVATLLSKMEFLANHRKRLYDIFLRKSTDWSEEDHAYLTEPSNHFLRGYSTLTQKGIEFFEKYLKGKNIPDNQLTALANKIRPVSVDADVEPEPIIIYTHDFIEKSEQKFRPANRFVYYAARYLIDHAITTDWYWEVEKFEPYKVKEFQKNIDYESGWRLSIENNHVTVAIPKNAGYAATSIRRAKNNSPQPMYQFSLGTRALRYLLALHLVEPEKSLNDFLAVALKKDFDALANNCRNNFILLEQQFIPQYLNENCTRDLDAQKNKIKNRIQYILDFWKTSLRGQRYLSRAKKNEIILNCYRLYDGWTVDNGTVKFLRKHEYQHMSICHYSLHTSSEQKNNSDKPALHKKENAQYLYENLFKLNKRYPPIPEAIKQLLYSAASLDDLMEKVIADGRIFLQQKLALLEDPDNGYIPIDTLIQLSRQLGLSVPSSLMSKEFQKIIIEKHAKSFDVLPFYIHPILVLKYYTHPSYTNKYNNPSIKGVSRQDNDIFKKLRTDQFTNRLWKEHYDTEFINNLDLPTNDPNVIKAYTRLKHSWIGKINTTLTEDALLWQIALKYLENNPYTGGIISSLSNITDTATGLRVGNIHKAKLTLPLKKGEGKHNKDDTYTKPIWMSLIFHQLDDVMYRTDYSHLRRAALHYISRHEHERGFWVQRPGHVQKDTQSLYTYTFATETVPSGTEHNPIPYFVLRQEMNTIAQHGIYLAGYFLDWERSVLYRNVQEFDDARKVAFLLSQSKKGTKFWHIDFSKIISLSRMIEPHIPDAIYTSLSEYRKRCFHGGVPLNGSYTYWARPDGEIATLFKIDEPLHWPLDRSMYRTAGGVDL